MDKISCCFSVESYTKDVFLGTSLNNWLPKACVSSGLVMNTHLPPFTELGVCRVVSLTSSLSSLLSPVPQ